MSFPTVDVDKLMKASKDNILHVENKDVIILEFHDNELVFCLKNHLYKQFRLSDEDNGVTYKPSDLKSCGDLITIEVFEWNESAVMGRLVKVEA